MQLDSRQRKTAQAILSHSGGHNLEWRHVISLFRTLGAVTEEHDGKVKIEVAGETETFGRPHGKDVGVQMLVDLRRLLTASGLTAEGLRDREDASPKPHANRTVGHALLVFDYHGATIYPTDAVGAAPTRLIAEDPGGTLRRMHHKDDDPAGWYGRLDDAWYARLAAALRPASEILIVGNGKGHSNATLQFTRYLAEHDRDLLTRIAGSVEADAEHLTEAQLLALAREFYGDRLPRDSGDGRWGEA
jgi:hypothetical protein